VLPIFGRAAITLGIGLHSSSVMHYVFDFSFLRLCISWDFEMLYKYCIVIRSHGSTTYLDEAYCY